MARAMQWLPHQRTCTPSGATRFSTLITVPIGVTGFVCLLYRSRGGPSNPRLSLGLLPAHGGMRRTANIITKPGHPAMSVRTKESAELYLQQSFPQLNIREMFDESVSGDVS